MSDFSGILGDLYGEDGEKQEQPAGQQAQPQPAPPQPVPPAAPAPVAATPSPQPEWVSSSNLDQAFADWQPGTPTTPAEPESTGPRSLDDDLAAALSAALAESDAEPAVSAMPTESSALVDAITAPEPVAATAEQPAAPADIALAPSAQPSDGAWVTDSPPAASFEAPVAGGHWSRAADDILPGAAASGASGGAAKSRPAHAAPKAPKEAKPPKERGRRGKKGAEAVVEDAPVPVAVSAPMEAVAPSIAPAPAAPPPQSGSRFDRDIAPAAPKSGSRFGTRKR